ncbi:MAG: hypothetical protein AMXMBFR34_32990 [Myxococcaceae bacterium]
MSWTSTAVVRKRNQWTVQVESSSGEAAELAYRSEAQARYFAAVLELRPSTLPRAVIERRLAELPEAPSSPGAPPRRARRANR